MTWTPHRTRNARKCDRCPPSVKAEWILTIPGQKPQYLCARHRELEEARMREDG